MVKSRPKTKGNDNLDDYDYGEDDTDQGGRELWETEESDEPDADGGGDEESEDKTVLTRFTDSPYERMMTRRPEGGGNFPSSLYLPATPVMAAGIIVTVSPAWDSATGSWNAWLLERRMKNHEAGDR